MDEDKGGGREEQVALWRGRLLGLGGPRSAKELWGALEDVVGNPSEVVQTRGILFSCVLLCLAPLPHPFLSLAQPSPRGGGEGGPQSQPQTQMMRENAGADRTRNNGANELGLDELVSR